MREDGRGKGGGGDAATHFLESTMVVFLHTHGCSCRIVFGYVKKMLPQMYSESKTTVSAKVVVYACEE